MIFASIMIYFRKNNYIGGDGLVGFSALAAFELIGELAIIAATIAK